MSTIVITKKGAGSKMLTRQQVNPQELTTKGVYKHIRTGREMLITGAEKRWKKNPNDIYLRDWRLVGTEADLKAFLVAAGQSAAEIQTSFDIAYHRGHLNDPVFLQEVEERKAVSTAAAAGRKSRTPTGAAGLDILVLHQRLGITKPGDLQKHIVITTSGDAAAAVKPGKGKGRGARAATLADTLVKNNAKGQAVDITRLTADGKGGKGAKITPKTKKIAIQVKDMGTLLVADQKDKPGTGLQAVANAERLLGVTGLVDQYRARFAPAAVTAAVTHVRSPRATSPVVVVAAPPVRPASRPGSRAASPVPVSVVQSGGSYVPNLIVSPRGSRGSRQ